jgi:hypothetical protein
MIRAYFVHLLLLFEVYMGNDFYKKWWFWVGLVIVSIIVANQKGGSSSDGAGSSVESNSGDSVEIANISKTHVLFTSADFDFIEDEGIYGLSSMWSTDNPVANKLADAESKGKEVAFKGKLGEILPKIEYRYPYTNSNTGCTKDHWVEVSFEVSEEQEKILGWEFRKGSPKELVVTGNIIKKSVKPAETACDNGVVKIQMSLDKVYDVKTNKVLID